jgi:hypothetical protein
VRVEKFVRKHLRVTMTFNEVSIVLFAMVAICGLVVWLYARRVKQGSSSCFTGHQLVRTTDGWKAVRDLKEGDEILGLGDELKAEAAEFMAETQGAPPLYTPLDKYAAKLARFYIASTEAYDLTVCTGPVVSGYVMPANGKERGLINVNSGRLIGLLVDLTHCYFCGEASTILMNTWLSPARANAVEECHGKVVDMEPCTKCAEHMKLGVILIAMDESKSKDGWAKERIPNPYRTGEMFVVRDEFIRRVIKPDSYADWAIKHRWMFIAREAAAKLVLLDALKVEGDLNEP